MPDGELMAQRDAPVGGQAVLEGVMMRGISTWAVAVRKPVAEDLHDGKLDPEAGAHGEIEVQSFPLVSWTKKHRVLRWPIIRGVVALVESLKIGFKALGISANAQLPASLIKDSLHSSVLFWLIEGIVRTAIFLGYLLLLSRLRDLRRVFEYHGAEHKTIACYEAGEPLTPENAARYSRLHPRCGTSFLLIVMIVAIFTFAPIGLPAWYFLVASRILGAVLAVERPGEADADDLVGVEVVA